MRKLLALVLAVMLVMSLAVSAFAASITIEGGAQASEYKAYKLLNATNDGDKYAYTLNDTYTVILQEVSGKTEQADIVAYIADLDDAGIREFADEVYAAIKEADPAIAGEYTITGNGTVDVDQGYYLVAENKVGDAADTFSLVMLDTAGDKAVTVTTKEDKPTVEKKVEEKNDSTGDSAWGDSADYDVGDVINYTITGTVSSKYADYLSYYYSFSDTMDAGLTMNENSVKVMIGDVDVTTQFAITYAEHGFTATANLKELTGVTVAADTKVIVTYTATLNKDAVSGSAGNKNEVILKYENDPYHKGDGNPETPDVPEKPGETPKDENIVFTYDVIVDKVDKDDEPLEGAGFTLYKWVEVTAATDMDEAVFDWAAVGEEITGVTTFEFKKLDEGKYKLEETTVPAGYNKAADVEFEIVSTLEGTALTDLVVKDKDGNVISSGEKMTFTVTKDTGKIETDIVNQSGTELPETGGIGTTIFYILGGVLVLAAVVLLVTKKRMAA